MLEPNEISELIEFQYRIAALEKVIVEDINTFARRQHQTKIHKRGSKGISGAVCVLDDEPVTGGSGGGFVDHESVSGPFDIVRTKSASVQRLKRWRKAALVLNASRRFRYTLDLKKEEEEFSFKDFGTAGESVKADNLLDEIPGEDFWSEPKSIS